MYPTLSNDRNKFIPPKFQYLLKRDDAEPLLGRYNWNHTYQDDYRTYYLYNPSIIPLHNTIQQQVHDNDNNNDNNIDDDPDALSATDLQELTGGDPLVRYVAIYRAYTGCNCFGRNLHDRSLMTAGEQLSYMAMTLLDENLDIVEGTDTLIDLNAGPTRRHYWNQNVEDCRILLLRGGIYLLCNEEMKRVKIKRKQQSSSSSLSSRTIPPPGYATQKGIQFPYVYPNIHGDGLEITILGQHNKIGGGKNFNTFRSTSKSSDATDNVNGNFNSTAMMYDYYLQTFPSPHQYRRLNIPDGRRKDDIALNNKSGKLYVISKKSSQEETAPQQDGLPRPTFDTPDTVHMISKCEDGTMNCTNPVDVPFFDEEEYDDHGTACCVRVFLPLGNGDNKSENNNNNNNNKMRNNNVKKQQQVMVGISHRKLSPRKNFWLKDVKKRYEHFGVDQFVSRFVAYDIHHPFDVVARSGWFCLGFADETESRKGEDKDGLGLGSTFAGRNTYARLDLFNETYDCPMIHFASGFSEVVGNNSRAIIGYGINDCHPRMFFVEKDEIAKLLTMTG